MKGLNLMLEMPWQCSVHPLVRWFLLFHSAKALDQQHPVLTLCQALKIAEAVRLDLCQRLLQAQQGRVLSFAMETVFVVFYLSIFLYYLLEVYVILIDILYELYPLLVGQLTHEKILICLIFPYFLAIFA